MGAYMVMGAYKVLYSIIIIIIFKAEMILPTRVTVQTIGETVVLCVPGHARVQEVGGRVKSEFCWLLACLLNVPATG